MYVHGRVSNGPEGGVTNQNVTCVDRTSLLALRRSILCNKLSFDDCKTGPRVFSSFTFPFILRVEA